MGEWTQEGPRERLMRLGAGALTDAELIALLLGTGTRGASVRDVAEGLLAAGGGLRALLQSDPHELCARKGLGPARAAQMVAALELGRRAQRETEQRPRLPTPGDIYRFLRPGLDLLRREEFHVLCLNSRNVLLRDARIAEGTTHDCPVDPREVFAAALAARAVAIVLAHNHPSGDLEPSGRDLSLTRQLGLGARLLGIRLLDHIIIGECGYTSLLERGLMAPRQLEAAEGPWLAAQ